LGEKYPKLEYFQGELTDESLRRFMLITINGKMIRINDKITEGLYEMRFIPPISGG
jgi:hypothetical protein